MPLPQTSIQNFMQQSRNLLKNYSGWRRFFHPFRHHVSAVSSLLRSTQSPADLLARLDGIEGANPRGDFARIRSRIFENFKSFMFHSAVHASRENMPALVAQLKTLSPELRRSLLLRVDQDGNNFLMLAVKNRQANLKSLLGLFDDMEDEQLAEIINTRNNQGENILFLAARHFPQALKRLSRYFQPGIHSATNSDQWNLLMLLVRHHPNYVPAYIDTIKDNPAIADILTQTSANGWNGLLIALRDQPASAAPLFQALITHVELPRLGLMLTQTTPDGLNALSLSVHRNHSNPEATLSIIILCTMISPIYTESILTQPHLGANALMLAINTETDMTSYIIKLVEKLPPDIIVEILSQFSDNTPANAMMRAIYSRRLDFIIDLLLLTNKLPTEQKIQVWRARAPGTGTTTLMYAIAQKNNEVFGALATLMSGTLTADERFALLSQKNQNGYTPMFLCAQIWPEALPVFCCLITGLSEDQKQALGQQLPPKMTAYQQIDFVSRLSVAQLEVYAFQSSRTSNPVLKALPIVAKKIDETVKQASNRKMPAISPRFFPAEVVAKFQPPVDETAHEPTATI